jgi:hypothetical protein
VVRTETVDAVPWLLAGSLPDEKPEAEPEAIKPGIEPSTKGVCRLG